MWRPTIRSTPTKAGALTIGVGRRGGSHYNHGLNWQHGFGLEGIDLRQMARGRSHT